MRPYQTFNVLEILMNSSSGPLYRKGVRLSTNDSRTVKEVYLQWLLLMIDLGYLQTGSQLLRDAQRLWSDLITEDVLSLNNSFAECLESIRLQRARGFKALCSQISRHLYSLIKDDFLSVLRGDIYAAKRLVQLFSYTSRLSLVDIDLTQQLMSEYLAIEEKLSSLDLDSTLTSALNSILRRWLGAYEPTDMVPNHGPGGIAERGRCSLEEKYSLLATDQRLTYAFRSLSNEFAHAESFDRCSKTIFVPKSYKTFRTISMEPATLQFYQQAVWSSIRTQVSRSGYLRGHIGFEDQTRNQRLARDGSVNRGYATIDLSAASDSVSHTLVKALFKGTWLARYLLATRSLDTQLPDGTRIRLKKFAPMGSALCFPIETLVFASICEYVTRKHRVAGDYSVYGDDIIVPGTCVPELTEVLTALGFSVNASKSFSDANCWFRESCGAEYCDGFDVTPMRISRKYSSRDDLVRMTKLIDLANTAFDRGFKHLRGFFLRKIQKSRYKPLFAPNMLRGDNFTNYHVRHRWNHSLQRIEALVSRPTQRFVKEDVTSQDEAIRLQHWLLTTHSREFLDEAFEATICRSTMVHEKAWMMHPLQESDQLEAESHPCIALLRSHAGKT